MKLTQLFLLALLFLCTTSYSQDKKESIFNKAYLSGELNYRSYGTNDQIGFGGAVEISKDIKKWLGVGINLSYWDNKDLDWDFVNPFTGQRYQYYGEIKEYKVSPFVQLIPLNTKYFDFIIQSGLRTGYYYQKYYLGGYNTTYEPQRFQVFIYDGGDKDITFGYELGIALRFQVGNFILVPSSTFANDNKGNSFSSLNLKIGWQLP